MARYLVLENRGSKREDDTTFIRDGFHVFAFVLPVVWLLWHRLWLQAALMFAVMGLLAAALYQFTPQAAPAITGLVNFSLGLLTALEGPAWLVADREKNGATVEGVFIARNLREAEELHAAELSVQPMPPRAPSGTFQPVSQASLIPLTGA
jgi:Protein of unknown function (DUF2628)